MIKKLDYLLTGLSEEVFQSIEKAVVDTNRRLLAAYSMPALIVLMVLAVNSFVSESLQFARIPYMACAGGILLLILVEYQFSRKYPWLVNLGVTAFICMIYIFGMCMGLFDSPDSATTAFIVILFAVPMVFLVRPIELGGLTAIAAVIYLFLDYFVKTPQVFYNDMVNILSFLVMSLVSSTIIVRTKFRTLYLELENIRISETDQLTGLYNRRKYENSLKRLEEVRGRKNVAIIAIDANEMKRVNDTKGHAGGDELLKGTAECLRAAFDSIGTCYRIGGDEFSVLIEDCPYPEDQLREMLSARVQGWKGVLLDSISVSVGVAFFKKGDYADLEELVHAADQSMYADKARYYSQVGHDRRRR